MVLCGAAAAQSPLLPDGFRNDWLLGGGLSWPTDLAVLPDGRWLITEKNSGRILLFANGRTALAARAAPLATLGEGGLLSVAVDPLYPQQPFLWTVATLAAPNRVALLRWEAQGDLSDPTSLATRLVRPTEILAVPSEHPLHDGGALAFPASHRLLMSLGDDFLRPCEAAAPERLRGVLLQLDAELLRAHPHGAPPVNRIASLAANPPPFAPPGAEATLAFGFRNPWRFALDPRNDLVWVADVGSSLFEELVAVSPLGGFAGWPFQEGNAVQPSSGCAPAPAAPRLGPAYSYAAPTPAGGACIVALGRVLSAGVTGQGLDVALDGQLLIGDFAQGTLRLLDVDGAGTARLASVLPGQPSREHFGEGFFGITSAALGPDGQLYWLDGPRGRLGRIGPEPNGAPSGTLELIAGGGQAANAGTPLFDPIRIAFRDLTGQPLAGQELSFSVEPAGSVDRLRAITDARGEVAVRFTPSARDPGDAIVIARAGAHELRVPVLWRGLTTWRAPAPLRITSVGLIHSAGGVPFTLAIDEDRTAPVAVYPDGAIWTRIFERSVPVSALDGLGLQGHPQPILTDATTGTWSFLLVNPPPLGRTVLLQAYAFDPARAGRNDERLISNPIRLRL